MPSLTERCHGDISSGAGGWSAMAELVAKMDVDYTISILFDVINDLNEQNYQLIEVNQNLIQHLESAIKERDEARNELQRLSYHGLPVSSIEQQQHILYTSGSCSCPNSSTSTTSNATKKQENHFLLPESSVFLNAEDNVGMISDPKPWNIDLLASGGVFPENGMFLDAVLKAAEKWEKVLCSRLFPTTSTMGNI